MDVPPPSKVNKTDTRSSQDGGEVPNGFAPQTDSVISISLCGSAPLLWQSSDLKEARDMKVVGALVGSLPRQPRQNVRLGRPLQLMREEARLLAQTGKAALVPPGDTVIEGDMHLRQVELYKSGQERSYEEQSALALQDRKAALLRAMAAQQKGGESGGEASNKTITDRLEGLEKGFTFPRSGLAVQLCTAKVGLAYGADEQSFLSTCWPAGPSEDQGVLTRFTVFRDLKRRGFYLTSAGKFGGDFLVYPGDPLRFHAHFIAVCVSMDEPMSLWDILAIARLGSNVKKTVLLCSSDSGEATEEVVYTSLQWSGMV